MNKLISKIAAVICLITPLTVFAEGDPWKHHFVKMSDGANLHYVTMGEGTPVVLLHGAGGSGGGQLDA